MAPKPHVPNVFELARIELCKHAPTADQLMGVPTITEDQLDAMRAGLLAEGFPLGDEPDNDEADDEQTGAVSCLTLSLLPRDGQDWEHIYFSDIQRLLRIKRGEKAIQEGDA